MDISPQGILRNWAPHLPSLIRLSILSAQRKSPNANHQDWLVEIFVAAARPILQTPAPLLKSQRAFMYGPPLWASTWIVNCTIPCPDNEIDQPVCEHEDALTIGQAVEFVINALATVPGDSTCNIASFQISGLQAEWISHRKSSSWWTSVVKTQEQAYDAAISDLIDGEDSPVILFAHGGAFCLMDPANHRPMTSALAKNTNSRVLAVRHRLSPQNEFPAALMDLFLCYLALLSPPPGALHQPVRADRIVLAGDSSGGNLVTALQILLTTLAQHSKTTIISPWQSRNAINKDHTVSMIEIPHRSSAALSILSPWLDITRSLPSQHGNSRWDFIAPPSVLSPDLISTSPLFPADSIWPANPPRTETYCEATICAHPLVSPLTVPSDVLRFFPSTYICVGWEGMTDETEVLARRIWTAKAGIASSASSSQDKVESIKHHSDSGYVSSSEATPSRQVIPPQSNAPQSMDDAQIIFDGYMAMPHTFSIIPFHRASGQANARRYDHINRALSNTRKTSFRTSEPSSSRATWTNTATKPMTSTSLAFSALGMLTETAALRTSGYSRAKPLTDTYVRNSVLEGRDFRVQLEKKLRQEAIARKTRGGSDASAPRHSSEVWIITWFTSVFWFFILPARDCSFLFFNWFLWQTMQFGIQL